jgi:hypothetical protein
MGRRDGKTTLCRGQLYPPDRDLWIRLQVRGPPVQYWNHTTLTQSKFLSALTHSALAEHAFGCQCRNCRNMKVTEHTKKFIWHWTATSAMSQCGIKSFPRRVSRRMQNFLYITEKSTTKMQFSTIKNRNFERPTRNRYNTTKIEHYNFCLKDASQQKLVPHMLDQYGKFAENFTNRNSGKIFKTEVMPTMLSDLYKKTLKYLVLVYFNTIS